MNKMGCHFAAGSLKWISLKERVCLSMFAMNLVLNGPVDIPSALIYAVVCCKTIDKQLLERMIVHFSDAYILNHTYMS